MAKSSVINNLNIKVNCSMRDTIQELDVEKVREYEDVIASISKDISELEVIFPYGKSIKFHPEELSEFYPLQTEDIDESEKLLRDTMEKVRKALVILLDLKTKIGFNPNIAFYTKEYLH